MKKRYKISLSIVFIFILLISAGYFWLINGWKKYLTEEELIAYTTEIKKEPPLPKEYKELYFTLYPKQKDASLTNELIERLTKVLFYKNSIRTEQNCSCDEAAYQDIIYLLRRRKPTREYDRLLAIKIGFGLEKYLTNEDCLNHHIRSEYREYSHLKEGYGFEGKNFDDLNRAEIIDFLIAVRAPSIYSPRRRQENYIRAKEGIEARLKQNN